jgi:acylphosphatase
MKRKRIHARVYGLVQGVAFREYTRREATRLGLSGWVRNLPDGSVEAVFEGDPAQAETLLVWLATGSPYAQVTRVEHSEESPLGETDPFFIRSSS